MPPRATPTDLPAGARRRGPLLGDPTRHSRSSRVLHGLGRLSESAAASAAAALVSAAFLVVALLAPRATPWLTAFQALAAAVTLVMVFALQHTQARQQVALQRKLDEILRVLPGADPRLVHVESAGEGELIAADERHHRVREEALSDRGEHVPDDLHAD